MENVNEMTPAELKAFKKAQKEERKANRIPGLFAIIWREVKRDKFALGALILMVVIIIAANIGDLFIDQTQAMRIVLGRQDLSPAQFMPLGTDSGGRDMFLQFVMGARTSLNIAIAVTFGSLLIGYTVGLIAGFYGGFIDLVVMRLIDVAIMVPGIMIIIVLNSVIPDYGVPEFIMVMVGLGWFGTAITFRARVLQESSRDYVLASKTLGTPNIVIMFKKVLPNVVSFMMVGIVLGLAFNIGLETGLTVIGYGLPFRIPSIGAMIANATNPAVMRSRPWQWVPAAALIVVMTMSIRLVGNAVSRAVNPRQRR